MSPSRIPSGESRNFDDGHHKPRDHRNKKKRKGFHEDTQERRAKRIGFKNYLRELEEEELDAGLDDVDDMGAGV
jgi:hypothetical protein